MKKKIPQKLTIRDLALYKQDPKKYWEKMKITKTHDGTSMGQGFMNHVIPFIKRHATSNVSRALIFETDKKMGVGAIDEDEISWNIEHSRSGGKDLNLIRNVGAKTEYDWHVDDNGNGFPFSVPNKEDMNLITEKNDYGEYAYRSMTLVSPGLKSMTLIRNNKFSTEDEKQYRKTVNKLYQNSENEEDGVYPLFLKGIKEQNIKLKNPDVTLYMIIELVSSTCFNSILYNEPLPIEQYKPFLYDAIRNLIHE